MRIRLEYEDGPVFSTLTHSTLGDYRVLLVKISSKTFTVWRTLEAGQWQFCDNADYIKEIDRALVRAMEQILKKLFMDACAAIPEGRDLMCDEEGNWKEQG